MEKTEEVKKSDYKETMRVDKKKRIMVLGFIGIIIAACFFYIVNRITNKEFNSYKIVHSSLNEYDSSTNFMAYQNGIIKYNRDGIAALSFREKLKWNVSYSVKNPRVSVCEGYVGVADIDGRQAYVINHEGEYRTITTALPIIDVEVSKQGVLCLTLEGEDYNQIKLYNPETGSVIVERQTTVKSDGFPVDVALSNDSYKLACSYVRTEKGVLESVVGFYNFSDAGEKYENKLVGVVVDQQTVVQDIVFLDSNRALLCADKGFTLYTIKESPKKVKSLEFNGEILSFLYSDKYFGYIIKTGQTDTEKELYLYNLEGKQILKKPISFVYQQVKICGEDLVFLNNSEVVMCSVKGKMKFKGSFETSVIDMFLANKKNEYIVVNNQSIQQIKLVEERK